MELRIDSAMGSMNEDIDIEKDGKDILIGFNPKFLIDALKVIDDEMIHIYLVNPKAPCFIRDDEELYIFDSSGKYQSEPGTIRGRIWRFRFGMNL